MEVKLQVKLIARPLVLVLHNLSKCPKIIYSRPGRSASYGIESIGRGHILTGVKLCFSLYSDPTLSLYRGNHTRSNVVRHVAMTQTVLQVRLNILHFTITRVQANSLAAQFVSMLICIQLDFA